MLIKPIIDKYFKYDRFFNLVRYDENIDQLYHDLLPLTKNEYESNYRFIFLHYDTDYYISNNQPGVLLRNLQKIVSELDISNYFCLVVTEQNIQSQLDQLRIEETNDSVSIFSIQTNLQDVLWVPPVVAQTSTNLIDKKYLCFNGVRRQHRTLLYGHLKESDLLDQGVVSYCKYNN